MVRRHETSSHLYCHLLLTSLPLCTLRPFMHCSMIVLTHLVKPLYATAPIHAIIVPSKVLGCSAIKTAPMFLIKCLGLTRQHVHYSIADALALLARRTQLPPRATAILFSKAPFPFLTALPSAPATTSFHSRTGSILRKKVPTDWRSTQFFRNSMFLCRWPPQPSAAHTAIIYASTRHQNYLSTYALNAT